jgi:hypothetical protein
VNFALIEKSYGKTKLSLYSDSFALIESESFDNLHTPNFHLQTLAKKHGIKKELLIVHDRDRNAVDMSIALQENPFYVS